MRTLRPAMTPLYLDPRTGETFPLEEPRWCGPNRAPLLLALISWGGIAGLSLVGVHLVN